MHTFTSVKASPEMVSFSILFMQFLKYLTQSFVPPSILIKRNTFFNQLSMIDALLRHNVCQVLIVHTRDFLFSFLCGLKLAGLVWKKMIRTQQRMNDEREDVCYLYLLIDAYLVKKNSS